MRPKESLVLIILFSTGCTTVADLPIEPGIAIPYKLAEAACLETVNTVDTDWRLYTVQVHSLSDGAVQYLECTLHSMTRGEYNRLIVDLSDDRYKGVRDINASLSAQGLPPAVPDLVQH